jgi:hypothetical protein
MQSLNEINNNILNQIEAIQKLYLVRKPTQKYISDPEIASVINKTLGDMTSEDIRNIHDKITPHDLVQLRLLKYELTNFIPSASSQSIVKFVDTLMSSLQKFSQLCNTIEDVKWVIEYDTSKYFKLNENEAVVYNTITKYNVKTDNFVNKIVSYVNKQSTTWTTRVTHRLDNDRKVTWLIFKVVAL